MDLSNKRVLVTGADGFIGSHLVERLMDEGADVKAFVYYNSFNSWGWIDTFPKEKVNELEIFTGDVRDPNGVRNAVKGMDIVFHLAALIGIPFSYQSPDSYIDTNVKGTLNILQACRDFQTEKVIVTSTSEVYGTAVYAPIDEKHPLQGQSPYAASKIGADKVAESFHLSFGLPVVIARPFNTYGPRQSARAVIPTIINQLLDGVEELKLGSLNPKKDYTYVLDTVEGFLELAKSENTIGEEINIASEMEISIQDIAMIITERINPGIAVIQDEARVRPEKSEVWRLYGSCKKMTRLTGWRPHYRLKEGLDRTIEWFSDRMNLEHYKLGVYNI